MTDIVISPFAWWGARRFRYNVGLVSAGVLAFIAYVVVGSTLLPAGADFEVTIFTTLFQGIGYFFMIGVANVCYFLGPVSEQLIHPAEPERYRRICYHLVFWFSVSLPFSIPVLLAALALLHPDSWKH